MSAAAASPRKVRLVLVLDAKSWLEVYVAGEVVAVEYHEPRRESSVGWVDHPRQAAGYLRDLLLVVRRALADKSGADAGELTVRLAGRISAAS